MKRGDEVLYRSVLGDDWPGIVIDDRGDGHVSLRVMVGKEGELELSRVRAVPHIEDLVARTCTLKMA
jgi:hypothetical protein